MKKVLAILLIAVLALTCLAACTDHKEEVDTAARYVVASMDGKAIDEAVLAQAGVASADQLYTIELKEDDKASVTAFGLHEDGAWTQDGDKITVTIDDVPVVFTVSGDELSANIEGADFIFARQ